MACCWTSLWCLWACLGLFLVLLHCVAPADGVDLMLVVPRKNNPKHNLIYSQKGGLSPRWTPLPPGTASQGTNTNSTKMGKRIAGFDVYNNALVVELNAGERDETVLEGLDDAVVRCADEDDCGVRLRTGGEAADAHFFELPAMQYYGYYDAIFEEKPHLVVNMGCRREGVYQVLVELNHYKYITKQITTSQRKNITFAFTKTCDFPDGSHVRRKFDVYFGDHLQVVVDGETTQQFSADTPYLVDETEHSSFFCLEISDYTYGLQPVEALEVESDNAEVIATVSQDVGIVGDYYQTCPQVFYQCRGVEETVEAVITFRLSLEWFDDITWSVRKRCKADKPTTPINIATSMEVSADVVVEGIPLPSYTKEPFKTFVSFDPVVIFFVSSSSSKGHPATFLPIHVSYSGGSRVVVEGDAALGGVAGRQPVPFWVRHECRVATTIDVTITVRTTSHDEFMFSYSKACRPMPTRRPRATVTANQMMMLTSVGILVFGAAVVYGCRRRALRRALRQGQQKRQAAEDHEMG